MGKKSPNQVDVYAGTRLRTRRMMLGKSQTDVGNAVGVTFQQIQKMERGFNRIAASRLQQLAKFLNVPVAYFFDGAPGNNGSTEIGADIDAISTFTTSRDGLSIIRSFQKLTPHAQRAFADVIAAAAQGARP